MEKFGKGCGPRIVYITHKGTIETVRAAMVANPKGPIFRNRKGKIFDEGRRVDAWKALRAKIWNHAGQELFPLHLSLYSCRHTYITRALRAGMRIELVAKLAGTSVKMIEKTYWHASENDLVSAARLAG